MNRSQYKNVIEWSIENESEGYTVDSYEMAGRILSRMGAELPGGGCESALIALMNGSPG